MSDKEINDAFICPVCIDVAYPPYITNCGHLLCEDCFSALGGLGSKCPKCRKKIEGANPSFEMKTYLEKFVSPEKKSRDFSSYQSKTTQATPAPAPTTRPTPPRSNPYSYTYPRTTPTHTGTTRSTRTTSSTSTSTHQYGSRNGESYIDTVASQLLWTFVKNNVVPAFAKWLQSWFEDDSSPSATPTPSINPTHSTHQNPPRPRNPNPRP